LLPLHILLHFFLLTPSPTYISTLSLHDALPIYALRVPIESQMVVFSKTSVQAQRINPQNPRTLFFNDSVVIGWVRGGFIEVAARSEEHTSELQSRVDLVCRLLLEKKKKIYKLYT